MTRFRGDFLEESTSIYADKGQTRRSPLRFNRLKWFGFLMMIFDVEMIG